MWFYHQISLVLREWSKNEYNIHKLFNAEVKRMEEHNGKQFAVIFIIFC